MKSIHTILYCLLLALFSCTSASKQQLGLDFSRETVTSYAKLRRNKDSLAIYHQQKVAYLSGIDFYNIVPKYLKKEDKAALLLVTSEGCIGCTYMGVGCNLTTHL